jgi:ATP-dependent HslUV protease subunit HslV
MGADGQVTVGELVMKAGARKVRRIFHDEVLVGFSGATADAFTLFERFERQLEHYHGNTRRAAVELAREWRSDRFLRELEAWLLIASRDGILVLSGTGDVVEPDDDLAAIGSGGPYAQAAARALMKATELDAQEITRIGLETAAAMCIYTNDQIAVETINYGASGVGPNGSVANTATTARSTTPGLEHRSPEDGVRTAPGTETSPSLRRDAPLKEQGLR